MDKLPPFARYTHTEAEFIQGLQKINPADLTNYLNAWLSSWRDYHWPSNFYPDSADHDILYRHALNILPWQSEDLETYTVFRERLKTPADIEALLNNPHLASFQETLADLAAPKDLLWPRFGRFKNYLSGTGPDQCLMIIGALKKRSLLPAGFFKLMMDLDKQSLLPRDVLKRRRNGGWSEELINQANYFGEISPFAFGPPDQETLDAIRHFLYQSALIAAQTEKEILEFIQSSNLPEGPWHERRLSLDLYYGKTLTPKHLDALIASPGLFKALHSSLLEHPYILNTPEHFATIRKHVRSLVKAHLSEAKKGERDIFDSSSPRADTDTLARLILISPLKDAYQDWLFLSEARPRLAWEAVERKPELKEYLLREPAFYMPFVQKLLTQTSSPKGAYRDVLCNVLETLSPEATSPILAKLAAFDLDDVLEWLSYQPMERRLALRSALKESLAQELNGPDRERRLSVISKIGEVFAETPTVDPDTLDDYLERPKPKSRRR